MYRVSYCLEGVWYDLPMVYHAFMQAGFKASFIADQFGFHTCVTDESTGEVLVSYN